MKQLFTGICFLLALITNASLYAQPPGTISSFDKLSGANFQIPNNPSTGGFLGYGLTSIGDIDGDGVVDLAAGIQHLFEGYVYILRMNADGTVKSYNRIGKNEGGFGDDGNGFLSFGGALSNMGDRDGNGVNDLLVGCVGGYSAYLLHLDTSGQVINWLNVTRPLNGYNEIIPNPSSLGIGVANIGDINNDGIIDVAVSDSYDGSSTGAIKIIFLNAAGTVDSVESIQSGVLGFTNTPPFGQFGISVAGIGDLDQDGTEDIMAGSFDTFDQLGKAYTIFLNPDGSVKSYTTITPGVELADTSNPYSQYSSGISAIGDIDGDSVMDVAISAPAQQHNNTMFPGRVYIVFMNTDGTVKGYTKIDKDNGGWTSPLKNGDSFGWSITPIGDFNGDGMKDIAVGAWGDDDADPTNTQRNSGAIYFFYLYGVAVTTSAGDIVTNETQNYLAYPNPTSDQLIIRPRKSGVEVSTATITDATGKTFRTIISNDGQQFQINVSELPSGNYFIQVKGKEKIEVVRFTKQ